MWESINADIVFVHGLLGGPFKTWRQQDRKGPGGDKFSDGTESVKKEPIHFAGPRIGWQKTVVIFVSYLWNMIQISVPGMQTALFETEVWRSLTVRASSILQKLKKADIGSRPIIWVGHSMGGLLIKQILSIADDTPGLDNIVNNTVGVLFYSTPHRGSSLAHLSNQASLIVAPTVEVKEMGRDSPMLRRLHKDFQQLVMEHGIPCLSFGELEKTQIRTPKLKMLIVPPESSDPGIGEFHAMKTSHLNICKPWDRDSELYTETLKFIRRCLLQGRIENILKAGMTFKDSDR
ncbi:SERAC1 [Mytilus edulis]|uniref:SERAC1 n=1 Tax=Mytilus edulis TaxID=6550 RepID=A0A8S3S7Q6_MYTED|nr:SERAC1 [Mytilus edulis]